MRGIVMQRLRVVALVVLCTWAAAPAAADVRELTARIAGTAVRYKVVLPAGYDPARPYPAVLVFGGGPQTMNTVERTLENNFRAEAERRGYIVIAPAAPDGALFFQEGARIFPEFLRVLLAAYRIRDGKFHVAGPSNGGIAALHVAAAHPQYFLSATAFPGYMWQPTEAKLLAVSKMCVFLYVGEHDDYRWHGEMKREVEVLRSYGTVARYSEEKGQPHRIGSLAGAGASRLFDGFEEATRGCSR
jgi:poly(3-hydroxybutyrate) depolymerase